MIQQQQQNVQQQVTQQQTTTTPVQQVQQLETASPEAEKENKIIEEDTKQEIAIEKEADQSPEVVEKQEVLDDQATVEA